MTRLFVCLLSWVSTVLKIDKVFVSQCLKDLDHHSGRDAVMLISHTTAPGDVSLL